MKRLLGEDYEALRAYHLGDFAHLLHMNPRQVDASRLLDFCRLIVWLERYHEAMKKRANEQNADS